MGRRPGKRYLDIDQGCRSKRFDLDPLAVDPDDDSGPAEFLIAAEKIELGLTAREAAEAEANVTAFTIQTALNQFGFTKAVLEDDLVQ